MSLSSPVDSRNTNDLKNRSALKVLIIDDDQFQLEFIADALKSLGISDITLADNGHKALQAIAVSRDRPGGAFDLLLSDLHMPGMDGFQFMASVAQSGFKGALIIVSGQDSKVVYSATLVAQLRRFNLLGTLQKPVTNSALSALVSKITK